VRAKGPTLVLDTGNALFQSATDASPEAKKKAAFILQTMGRLQTAAMAPGTRDLAAGLDWLKATAASAKLPLLSANLTRDKHRVFDASKVVTVGGVKVGLVGVSPPGTFANQPGLLGEPPVAAALAEAKKLKGKVDLVVALAAVPYPDALQLARDGAGVIDLVLQSSDSRVSPMAQKFDDTFVLASGERGRQVIRLDLDLTGKGRFVDVGEQERERQTLSLVTEQIAETKRRMEVSHDAAVRKQYEETLKSFEARKAQLAQSVSSEKEKGARTLAVSLVDLGGGVPSDPAIKAEVDKLQPPTP
jgi:2',3'-cyclic-nucleotide 2'-phosphodiesterase (5'-nucleotidase family)